MPEFFIRFDLPMPSEYDDYLDLSPLIGPDFDIRCKNLGLKSLLCWEKDTNPNGDFSGISRAEHDAMNSVTPSEYRVNWKQEYDMWHDCADGLMWCDSIINFVRENPDPTIDQPSGLDIVLDELNALQNRLRYGAKMMAQFQIYFNFE